MTIWSTRLVFSFPSSSCNHFLVLCQCISKKKNIVTNGQSLRNSTDDKSNRTREHVAHIHTHSHSQSQTHTEYQSQETSMSIQDLGKVESYFSC